MITQDETEPGSEPEGREESPEPRKETESDEDEEEEEPPPERRPPPLISLSIPQTSQSDDDDDDDDDDWVPNPRFANLKRPSVFVARGQLDDTGEEDGPGPSVEYIP